MIYQPRDALAMLVLTSHFRCSCISEKMFVFNILALGVTLRLAAAAPPTGRAIINPQLGPYPVTISNVELQTDRDDPLAPEPGTKRRLMLSIFQPQFDSFACTNRNYAPYMPNRTAEATLNTDLGGVSLSTLPGAYIEGLQVEYCAQKANATTGDAPILLFQHGYQGSRLEYQVLLSGIASSGYTIVSIDITYEAPVVEFPDGSYVLNNTGFTDDGLGPDDTLPVRAADYSSVIDALESGKLVISSSQKTERKHVKPGVFGHSIGGAAAVLAASQDKRIAAAVNWDGQFFPAQANLTVHQPTLLFQREQVLPYQKASWEQEWALLKGSKAWIAGIGTEHLSFTDLPILAEAEGLREGNEQIITALGGSIAPGRMREIAWKYTVDFFDGIFKDGKAALLDKPSTEFPDVRFLKTSVRLQG
ncbi:hypothetical protein BDV96DRAFT_588656 [Lophiotrema nucula]|uniref:1-alkyl-2-acetylglycerophosphocholine esterase n=1 Tax=Lophiotrema nucula TaxID=690887 RepID=A0A6A5YKE8_9PLEO|nr:hypothetical protein BDV96DRAFT_588656 [Lophiotrema nucula]